MAYYMTQVMSSVRCEPCNYYRKQSSEHVSHVESGKFTGDAMNNYAVFNHIPVVSVVAGRYMSEQGVPTGGKTYEI
jgi:hypothetical protein